MVSFRESSMLLKVTYPEIPVFLSSMWAKEILLRSSRCPWNFPCQTTILLYSHWLSPVLFPGCKDEHLPGHSPYPGWPSSFWLFKLIVQARPNKFMLWPNLSMSLFWEMCLIWSWSQTSFPLNTEVYVFGWLTQCARATGPQNFQYNPVIWFEWLWRDFGDG